MVTLVAEEAVVLSGLLCYQRLIAYDNLAWQLTQIISLKILETSIVTTTGFKVILEILMP